MNQVALVLDDKPTLLDIDDLSDEEDSQGNVKPRFDERNKCFELDSCLGFGKVCLVYKEIASGIAVFYLTSCKINYLLSVSYPKLLSLTRNILHIYSKVTIVYGIHVKILQMYFFNFYSWSHRLQS